LKRYDVLLSESAVRFLRRTDNKTAERIKNGLKALVENPFQNRPRADIKQLVGSFDPVLYRIRIGDYRIIYAVSGSKVKITEIIIRGKGYKWLD
jgi:mRNA interferase RelE/StbE